MPLLKWSPFKAPTWVELYETELIPPPEFRELKIMLLDDYHALNRRRKKSGVGKSAWFRAAGVARSLETRWKAGGKPREDTVKRLEKVLPLLERAVKTKNKGK